MPGAHDLRRRNGLTWSFLDMVPVLYLPRHHTAVNVFSPEGKNCRRRPILSPRGRQHWRASSRLRQPAHSRARSSVIPPLRVLTLALRNRHRIASISVALLLAVQTQTTHVPHVPLRPPYAPHFPPHATRRRPCPRTHPATHSGWTRGYARRPRRRCAASVRGRTRTSCAAWRWDTSLSSARPKTSD